MSQTIGLMAEIDIETEHLRWMGDTRFIVGYLRASRSTLLLLVARLLDLISHFQSLPENHVQSNYS